MPPATASYVAAYQNDLNLRAQANNELRLILMAQRGLLLDLQQNSVVGQAEADLLGAVFKDINVVVSSGGNDCHAVAGWRQGGGNSGSGLQRDWTPYAVNQQNLNNDQQGYNSGGYIARELLLSCRA